MGMSIHVRGVRNLDGKFAKMMKIKLACDDADEEYPPGVAEYFGKNVGESEESIRDTMEEIDIREAISDAGRDMQDIREVDLSKLTKEVKRIRFIVSY